MFCKSETEVAIDLYVGDLHVTCPQRTMGNLFSELVKHLLIKVSTYPATEPEHEYVRAERIPQAG